MRPRRLLMFPFRNASDVTLSDASPCRSALPAMLPTAMLPTAMPSHAAHRIRLQPPLTPDMLRVLSSASVDWPSAPSSTA